MSRLRGDPHPRTTTTKPSPASTSASASAAAQLLLRRAGRRAAAKDESIAFFSALRERQPDDPRASGQPGRGGKVRRSVARDDELLSSEIGKNDYDWLLPPPSTSLWSPAKTAGAGHRVSAAAPNRLDRARSASYAKSNSRGMQPAPVTSREIGSPASRLPRSSSAAMHAAVNRPRTVSSGRPSHARTLSSASSSSSINSASNASVKSTPRRSPATSPRTPSSAVRSAASSPRTPSSAPRSAASSTPRLCHRDKAQELHVFGSAAGRSRASSSSATAAPPPSARSRGATRPMSAGTSIPRSTTTTSQQPAPTRRGANAVARSRFASQITTLGSTPKQAASPAPRPLDVATSKPRPVPAAAVKQQQTSIPTASATNQSGLPTSLSAAPAAAGRSARREEAAAQRSARNRSDFGRNIAAASTIARRAVALVNGSQNRPGDAGPKRARNVGAMAAPGDPALPRRSSRSLVTSKSRLGLMSGATETGAATALARSASAKGKLPKAAATARVAEHGDSFPSTRYDAMLLREDPRNLTWLHGNDDGGGVEEVSLQPFDVPAGMIGTARF